MGRRSLTAALLSTALMTLLGCSGNDFASTSTKKSSGNANAGKQPDDGKGNGEDGGKGDGESNATDAAAAGKEGEAAAKTGADAAGAGGVTPDEAECLVKKAELYNIVLVFDTSGSQLKTDPTKLRITGAKDFVTKLTAFADANPTVTINVSTAGFARRSTPGAHGWQKLAKATLATVTGDIDTLNAGIGIGTNFVAGLEEADKLLVAKGAATKETKQRNFIVFMTDGEPNAGGGVNDIVSETTAITKNRGVAMIMLGTGTGVGDEGTGVLKQMALPNPGIVNAKHIGQFFAVTTPSEMANISTILSKSVAACE